MEEGREESSRGKWGEGRKEVIDEGGGRKDGEESGRKEGGGKEGDGGKARTEEVRA